VFPPADARNWSHALLLDLNGRDLYRRSGRKDNHTFIQLDHALCYDTQYGGVRRPQRVRPDFVKRGVNLGPEIRRRMQAGALAPDLALLLSPLPFARHAAVGRLVRKKAAVVPDLTAVLATSTDTELNRDLVEVLDILLLSGELSTEDLQLVMPLLRAEDAFVRSFAVLAVRRQPDDIRPPLLAVARQEADDRVRALLIGAVGAREARGSVQTLADFARTDGSETCRVNAVGILGETAGIADGIPAALLECLNDPSTAVRAAAAAALGACGSAPRVLPALEARLQDTDVYVRRAAARSLIRNGQKSGIPVLIESLDFPSIDVYPNYDQDIAKELAYYCGVDFPESRRYAAETWRNWWAQNGRRVDLDQNLAVMDRIQAAFRAATETEGLRVFEALRSEMPTSEVVARRYDRFCYEWITFRLMTRQTIDRSVLERCLRLQKIRTEIDPRDPAKWVSLAYFHGRLAQYAEAVSAVRTALEIDPANPTYRAKLQAYESLRQDGRRPESGKSS
jgi:hypothetical protein